MLLPSEQHSQVVRTSLHLFMFTRNIHYNKSMYEYVWPRHFENGVAAMFPYTMSVYIT